MNGADARARQHGDGGFGDHRHVYCDAVAFLGTDRFQPVGEFADFGVKFAVGDLFIVLRIVAFPDDRNLIAFVGQVAVETIGGGV